LRVIGVSSGGKTDSWPKASTNPSPPLDGLINTRFAKIQSVNKEDIQRVAKTYLTVENRTVVTTLPKPKPAVAAKAGN
jgi:hypothetical protein